MNWLAFDTAEAQSEALARAVAADLAVAIERDGQAVLAVSGGRSPVPFLERLARSELDWSRVAVTLVDERVLPDDHADSNARLVREHLLQDRAAAARFIALATQPDNAELSAEEANAAYRQPTVAVLGMGDDGHTASLFPNADTLAAGLDMAGTQPILCVTPPVAPHRRLSMTRPALLKCGKLYLSIQGETKRAVFDRARVAEDVALPVSCFLQQKETPLDVYWAP